MTRVPTRFRYMDVSQGMAKLTKGVVLVHTVPFRSCEFSSIMVHAKGTALSFMLLKCNNEWWVRDTATFIKAMRIPKLIICEATSQLHDLQMQVIDACAAHGISLIAEPHIVYHDTFPYRLILALSATVNNKELRFWASIDIELEI